MKHDHRIIVRIIGRMMHYLYSLGAKKINVEINELDLVYVWIIECEGIDIQHSLVMKLRKLLSIERQTEIEEAFSIPSVEYGNCHELSIIGMSIDSADVGGKSDYLRIKMTRNKRLQY